MHEAARICLYGLLAAASPVTLLATLVVLAGKRGRANGVAFAAAFVAGQSIAFLVAFSVGATLTESAQHTATAYIELAAESSCSGPHSASDPRTSRGRREAHRGRRRSSRTLRG